MQTRVTCDLHDGRVFDLTGLSAEEAVARLRAAGVRTEDIARTTHALGLSVQELRRLRAQGREAQSNPHRSGRE